MEETTTIVTGKVIIAALSTLTPPETATVTATIAAVLHHHCRRIAALLSSPTLFSLSLNHLHSLSLSRKTTLIARHLLSLLSILGRKTATPRLNTALNNRDLDSVLLLLLLCELHQHNPESLTSQTDWRVSLCDYVANTMLSLSGIGFSKSEILIKYVELVSNYRRLVGVMGGGGGEVAADVAAVVALPLVEVKEVGKECVVCKEEMKEGRDVCELPCEHKFHRMCVLTWLMKRNTCPCCRYRLPTDDVYNEIERQWAVLVKIGGGCF